MSAARAITPRIRQPRNDSSRARRELTTGTGLKVYARLDEQQYPKVEVSDEQLAAVNLVADAFHPEWNYTIKPSDN